MTETPIQIENGLLQTRLTNTIVSTDFDSEYKVTVTEQTRKKATIGDETIYIAGTVNRYEGTKADFLAAGVTEDEFNAVAGGFKAALEKLVAYRKAQAAQQA